MIGEADKTTEAIAGRLNALKNRLSGIGRAVLKGQVEEWRIKKKLIRVEELYTSAWFQPAYDLQRSQYRVIIRFETPIVVNRVAYIGSVSCYITRDRDDVVQWHVRNWMTKVGTTKPVTSAARQKISEALQYSLHGFAHPSIEGDVAKMASLKSIGSRLDNMIRDVADLENSLKIFERESK